MAESEIPQDVFTVMSVLSANAEKNFVQRIMSPDDYPKLYDGPQGEMGEPSSHSMAWGEDGEGNAYVYPTVIQKDENELYRFKNTRAAEYYAKRNNELIHFGKDKKAAAWFASDKGYKLIWGKHE